jgi:hypothetical protein
LNNQSSPQQAMEIAIAIVFKAKGILIMKKELTVIGIIPQYPRHSQNNIYAKMEKPVYQRPMRVSSRSDG